MFTTWATIVFAWPAVGVALTAFGVAVIFKSRALALFAVCASAPLCFYVSGYPAIRGLGLVVLGTNFGGVFALWRGYRGPAVILWAPFAMLTGSLAFLVFGQRF